ncbi:MAG: DUF3047 domain-containing protein [Undibacterium sp.]|nr:DUF3047 domain-containing protein [Opitutaceae bacterium]
MVRRRVILLLLAFGVAVCRAADPVSPQRLVLFDELAPGWRARWSEQGLFSRPTLYSVVTEAERPALLANSVQANSGLIRRLPSHPPPRGRLSWRWKVLAPLAGIPDGRARAGDDYAARVFVVFEPLWLPLRTRAINYAWSAKEPVGATYASPYTRNVGLIVLRSGSTEAGRWCEEARDVAADYRRFFGELPRELTAVAVLVDNDNPGGRANPSSAVGAGSENSFRGERFFPRSCLRGKLIFWSDVVPDAPL